MFRIAKVMGIWDVDKLENEMPCCMIAEWNEYLNYELSQLAQAVLGAVPAARNMSGSNNAIKLTDPEQIGGFFDALNKGN